MTTIDLATLILSRGSHRDYADGVCLFEAYNLILDGHLTDARPPDVSPILHAYGIALNDSLPDDKRQQLQRWLPQPDGTDPLAGTATDGLDEARSFVAFDWLVRTYAPAWLDLAGLVAEAQALRGLPPIVDLITARAARSAITAAQTKATAARAAAWDVARDATGDAALAAVVAAAGDAAGAGAVAAAWDAVVAAAGDIAVAAAWAATAVAAAGAAAAVAAIGAATGDAAGDAAGAAARDAAHRHLAPTVSHLQDSALKLLDALIAGRLTARTGDTE